MLRVLKGMASIKSTGDWRNKLHSQPKPGTGVINLNYLKIR